MRGGGESMPMIYPNKILNVTPVLMIGSPQSYPNVPGGGGGGGGSMRWLSELKNMLECL